MAGGSSPWLDLDALYADMLAPSAEEFARYFLNTRTDASSRRPRDSYTFGRRRPRLGDDQQILLGFDGSRDDEIPVFVYKPPAPLPDVPQRAPTYLDDDGCIVHAITTLPERE